MLRLRRSGRHTSRPYGCGGNRGLAGRQPGDPYQLLPHHKPLGCGSFGSVHGTLGALEQLPHPLAQGVCLGGILRAIVVNPLGGGLLRLLQQFQVKA